MHGMNDKTLSTVRELGFNHCLGIGREPTETVFFLGPDQVGGHREDGAHATAEAILDFIAYYRNQIQVAKDYLINDRNNKTYEWSKTPRDGNPSVEALSVVQEILREQGHVNIQFNQIDYGARLIDDLVRARVARTLLDNQAEGGKCTTLE
jgi:hypothetical protein